MLVGIIWVSLSLKLFYSLIINTKFTKDFISKRLMFFPLFWICILVSLVFFVNCNSLGKFAFLLFELVRRINDSVSPANDVVWRLRWSTVAIWLWTTMVLLRGTWSCRTLESVFAEEIVLDGVGLVGWRSRWRRDETN